MPRNSNCCRALTASGPSGTPTFGLFGNLGKPLVLGIDGDAPVYLLIDFRWFTGINQARRWEPVLREWLSG